MRKAFLILLLLNIFGGAQFIWAQKNKHVEDTLTIAAVGDLMIGSNYPSVDYLPKPEEGNILLGAMPFLKKADLRLGNLEGSIADTVPVFKDCGDGKNCYAFRTPLNIATWYKEAGFNYLNLSNNHSYDFGPDGNKSTMEFLKNNNIRTSGVYQKHFDTMMVKHTLVGFLSFAPHKNCLNLNNDSMVIAEVTQARKKCDLLVIYFHGGAEGATKMHVAEGHEMFYDQDRGDLKTFTHNCIDAGADLVIGSGPHIVRGIEMYKDKLIAYSLGNFATYHLFNLKHPMDYAPLLKLKITSKGKVLESRVISFIQRGEGIPKYDKDRTAYRMIKALSESDFGYKEVKK